MKRRELVCLISLTILLAGCEIQINPPSYRCSSETAEQRRSYLETCRVDHTVSQCLREAEWLYCDLIEGDGDEKAP